MPPRKRRVAAAADGPSGSTISISASGTATAAPTLADAPRRRGRPAKPKAPAISAESASSAPSVALSGSDNGEDYSTTATSNVVTPVPSTSTNQPKSTGGRPARLANRAARPIVELPDDVDGDPADKPRAFRSRAKRTKQPDDDSDGDEYIDPSPDAVLARRLQREEDEKAAAGSSAQLLFESRPDSRRRSTRLSRVTAQPDTDNEEDDLWSQHPEVGGKDKGKGKASTGPLTRKRKALIHNGDGAYDDVDDYDNVGEAEDGNDGDAELSFTIPARKKTKAITPQATSHQATSVDDGSELPSISDGSAFEFDNDDVASYMSLDSDNDEQDSDGSEAAGDNAGNEDPDPVAAHDNRAVMREIARARRGYRAVSSQKRAKRARDTLEKHHPELKTMWDELRNIPILKEGQAKQPSSISRQLKPFQLEGLAWMKKMENLHWKGGVLGDEMGLGKTIQAVSLIMSDYPAKNPSLVLVPPVALMQWMAEIESYTDGRLKTLVFHGTNSKAKNMAAKDLKKYDVLIMSYNTLESMYRKQEKGFQRKAGLFKEKSAIHSIKFHRVILDEAHCVKTRTTMTAKACFALKADYRWCLTGTPLQNRIGEFFSLIRFLNMNPFASYFCKQCPCSTLEWTMDDKGKCTHCQHVAMRHVSVFNQELLNPIQKYGNVGKGLEAFKKLRLLTDRIMLRRLKKDHTNAMELPVKEIYVDRQFFGEEENDFANSIMNNGQRKFDTYVAQGVLLNNYANVFGLIMQMRQVADHPDLILKKSSEGGQNILQCCICDEPAEQAIRSRCKHDFCRDCAKSYVNSQEQPDCPRCHIPLSIDLEQPEMEQDGLLMKKSSIINRINMENWTSSSKIELLVHELHKLRSDNASHKSIIFSQFTTMLQLIEWRLRRAGITTVMLDGSMTPAQRAASINHFMNNVDVECFLVSLKAGGVALNLTEASRVFIVDPWWNPAAEWQSADRCHRIGQTRPCTVTRLCIEDSVESRIVLLQEKKTNMINSTINSDDAAMESLTPEDLQFLFRGD